MADEYRGLDLKTKRINLIPHRDDESENTLKVTEALRGDLKPGESVVVVALDSPTLPKDATKKGEAAFLENWSLRYGKTDLPYRIRFETGKRYLLVDLPNAQAAHELKDSADQQYRRAKEIVAKLGRYEKCRELLERDKAPPATSTAYLGSLSCSIRSEITHEKGIPAINSCELVCSRAGKEVFRKPDYCADNMIASPSGRYLLGLSAGQHFAYWVVDADGGTWSEVRSAELPQDWLYPASIRGGDRLAAKAKRSAGANAQAPMQQESVPFLVRYGPEVRTVPYWYNRLAPNAEWKEPTNQLSEISIELFDGTRRNLTTFSELKLRSDSEWTKFHWANPSPRVVRWNDDLTRAVDAGKKNEVRALLERGANPNCIQDGGRGWDKPSSPGSRSLLGRAIDHHFPEIALLLLSHGASPSSDSGFLLYASIREGEKDVLDALLAAKADVNVRYSWGWTPLMIAAMQGRAEMVRQLLKAGADPKVKDSDGKTALAHAREKKHSDCAKILGSN